MARKRSKTKHEQPVHEASVSVTTTASNEQTAAAETTPENGAQPADSSALQPAHDSSSPRGIMWAYFNLWDSADAQDDVVPFNVVPTTRRLHPDEEEQLVAYFFRFGLKKIPSGLPYVDGGKSVYFLSAEAMREMYKLAAAGKEIESIALGRMLMVAAESWTMYVKRMTVTGTQELTELCERAYEKVALRERHRNAERSADLAQQFARMALFSGSVARPADLLADGLLRPATYLISQPSAAPPGGSSGFYRIAFYNISSGRGFYNMDSLATEICKMVHDKSVDAVGIGGLPLALQVPEMQTPELVCQTCEMWTSVLQRVMTKLNESAERAAWKGQSDGHYIFVWNSQRLVLKTYNYVSCGVEEQPWRMAQYLQFRDTESRTGPPLHVCHCHSPSDKVAERRVGPMPQRARTFETLWGHVMTSDPVEDPDSATQPVSIFGGNFDCTAQQWLLCLERAAATQASRRSVQLIGDAIFNDQAAVFNAFATREDLGCMPGNDHNVVLVSLCWRRHTPANTASAVVAEATSGPAPPTKSTLRATPY